MILIRNHHYTALYFSVRSFKKYSCNVKANFNCKAAVANRQPALHLRIHTSV